MWLAVLLVWGSFLPLAASEGCPEASEDTSSWLKLKPLGHCKDGENTCPYRITLPPLTIQLPRPFRELEKMARELQSLTQVVNQLKSDCRECKERQRMEWSLRTASGGEDGDRIQASRGTVNTKERQQDLPKGVKVVPATSQKNKEGTVQISSGTKQVNPSGTEKQKWNASQERNLNPSSTRHRNETNEGPKGSNPSHMERIEKLRETQLPSAGEGMQSPRPKLIGSQDRKQPTKTFTSTFNTRERQQEVPKGVEVTIKKPENTRLISDAKQVNPTDIENLRWNTSRERNLNPNSAGHSEDSSERITASNPSHMEEITDGMGKITETHSFLNEERGKDQQSSQAEIITSSLPENQDEEQTTQASSAVNTRERQQDVLKRVAVQSATQKTEDGNTELISKDIKEANPSGMKNQRWNPSWERNLNQSSTSHQGGTSGGPEGFNPVHMESMSNVRPLDSLTSEERAKEQHYSKLNESLSESTDTEQPTKASSDTVNTRERQQDVSKNTKVVQGTVKKTEEHEVLINTGTIDGNPTKIEKERWTTSRVSTFNPSSTKHREESRAGPKGSNRTHIETRTESISNVGKSHSFTAEERKKLETSVTKQIELYIPENPDKEHPESHDEKQPRYHGNPKVSTAKTAHGKNTSTTSVGTMVSEDGVVKIKHLNPPNRDKVIKRFPGFPRLINTNRTKLNPITEGRFENPGVKTKVSSPNGDKTLKGVGERSGFTANMTKSNDKSPHKNPITEGRFENPDVKTRVSSPTGDRTLKGVGERSGFTANMTRSNEKIPHKNPSTEGRFENPGVKTKVSSPTGDKTLKGVGERSGFTSSTVRSNEKTPHKADGMEQSGSGLITPDLYSEGEDAHRPDIIRSTSKIIDRKELKPKISDITEANIDQQSEHEEEVSDTGELRPFTPGETSDFVVTKDSSADMVPYSTSESKGNKSSNHSTSHIESKSFTQGIDSESDPKVDTKSVETVSGSEKLHSSISDSRDVTFDVKFTHPQTHNSDSENPFSPRRKAESDTGVNSGPLKPVVLISRPGEIKSSVSDRADATTDVDHPHPEIWDSENPSNPSTHVDGGPGVGSSPLNVVDTVSGLESRLPFSDKTDADLSSTIPQSLDNIDDLPKQQLKPNLNPTRPSSKETKGSTPIKAKTERKDVLTNNKATTSRPNPVKQTYTTRNTEDNSPVRGVRPGAPIVGLKVRGRPRPNGLIPIRTEELNPPVNSTKKKEEVKELQPNLRMLKNSTSQVRPPGKNISTRVILTKNPNLRKPYMWPRMKGNRSLEAPLKKVENSSRVTEHMVETERRQVHSKTGVSSSGPKKEFKNTANDMIQSVKPNVETHTIVDHAERANISPTVEALNSLSNHQIQNTSPSPETKLFHVTEPENPRGKQGLDPITSGVRKQSGETVMNQNTESHDSNYHNRPDSHEAVVKKTEGTDGRKETNPITTSSVNSNQDNVKKLKAGSTKNSSGKILQIVKVSTETNELNYPTTTATTFTMKTRIMDKQSQMTQLTTPVVTTPHLMTQDLVAKISSGVKISHVHPSQSQDVESERPTGARSDSDRRKKEQNPNLQGTGTVGGSSKGTVLFPKVVNRVKTRAKDSDHVLMERIKTSTGSKGSTPSTDIAPQSDHENNKPQAITVASVEGNNGDNNGKLYPVAVDRTKNKKTIEGTLYKTTAESTIEKNNARSLANNKLEDREDLENQLLSTCHGQCDPRPTPQPIPNIQRASEKDRDKFPKDCSDLISKNPKNGVYSVTPTGLKNGIFRVFCDMETSGDGWTLIQHRFDGSISFNRTWNDYKRGFGNLTGEFWLGNDKIHWLTSAKAMVLRIELEDLDGIKEYAQYDQFHVANESQQYRLTIEGYSGTAGNSLQFSKKFNHNQKNFTTPDRDNDQYPSGNCGAYYSSGWWFDACMAANLNGKYYQTKYKGVRNGIFWGTWHNISTEYYPTNDRQSFKTVKMMVRPRLTTGRDY